MTMRLDLDLNGDKIALRKIDALGDRALETRPLLVAVGKVIQDGIAKQWETGGAYLGGEGSPWPDIAKSTAERKAREGLSATLHGETGKLQDSLTGGQGSVIRITKLQVRVGTRDPKAYFHQGGTSRGIPARKLVGIAPADRPKIFSLLRKHMTV